MFSDAAVFDADITNQLVDSAGMFFGADAWLDKYVRTDGGFEPTAGPPSAWTIK
jgi:hypothetical protein